jgi:flavorubredoxin
MKPVQITNDIYWVGAIDWDLRNFHGYLTQRGSTYNAYLVMDEKITLIDTVKHYMVDEMLERIKRVVDPAKIDYIVSNHVEMDHSGGLPRLKELCPNAKILTSPNGQKGLHAHYGENLEVEIVKTGDTLDIGKRTLQFILAQMVHWPDNMACYIPGDNILFSNDAFGQHIATAERFDDEYQLDIVIEEAKKYYANIVLPYGKQVQKVLEGVGALDISIIAPSHGLIWRESIDTIVAEYHKWAANSTKEKALIIYDTMWNSTRMIAGAIQSAFEEKGIHASMHDLKYTHISDIMTEVLTAKYICVGSPTLNNNMLPNVAAFLTYMKGLSPKNRIGLAFGSYGWGGQSIGQVEKSLEECGYTLFESIKVQYIPDKTRLHEISASITSAIDNN